MYTFKLGVMGFAIAFESSVASQVCADASDRVAF
jgi:hypothetical protein